MVLTDTSKPRLGYRGGDNINDGVRDPTFGRSAGIKIKSRITVNLSPRITLVNGRTYVKPAQSDLSFVTHGIAPPTRSGFTQAFGRRRGSSRRSAWAPPVSPQTANASEFLGQRDDVSCRASHVPQLKTSDPKPQSQSAISRLPGTNLEDDQSKGYSKVSPIGETH